MKKILTKRSFLLMGLLSLVFLVLPQVVDGVVLDPIIAALTATSKQIGASLTIFMVCFVVFLLGTAALFISTALLQSAIETTPEALTVLSGDAAQVVQAGWNFTVGIANMALLIAFIAIAISIILGLDNFSFKKALPKLIVVALLMNFTLLFVGAGIDISNFLFNSVAGQFSADGGNILWDAMEPLRIHTAQVIIGTTVFLGGLYALQVSVIGAILGQAIFATFVLLLPFILEFLILGIIMLLLSSVFLLFFFILIARIFIIQILAILAPLAFFCLIFDETKKWWGMWLHHLVQWLFVGVLFIFFMYIGLALAPLVGTITDPLVDLFPWWLAPAWSGEILSHIVLLIYFFVILGVVRKLTPALASAAIAQAKGAISAVSPYVGAIRKGSMEKRNQEIREKAQGDSGYKDKMEGWSMATAPPGSGALGWVGANVNRLRARPYTSAVESGGKKLAETAKDLKGKKLVDYVTSFSDAVHKKNYTEALATYLAAVENNVPLHLLRKNIDPHLRESTKKLEEEATLLNKDDDYKKFVDPHGYLARKNEGKSEAEKQKNTQELLVKFSPQDIEKMAKVFVAGAKNTARPDEAEATKGLFRELIGSSKQMQRALAKKGEKEGIQLLYQQARGPSEIKAINTTLARGMGSALIPEQYRGEGYASGPEHYESSS